MTANIGYVKALANLLGTSEPALRLLLTILIGYPLAIVYRNFIYNSTKLLNHIFIVSCGITICLFNYGYEIYHSLLAVFMTYIIIRLFNRTKYLVPATFLFHMSYLLTGYYYTGTETYDIKWTMPHCVLVLRLIGLAFDIADGQIDESKLSVENKKSALKEAPNFLEIASYTYFPASVLVGPQFPYRRYEKFLNKEFDEYKGHISAGFKRGAIGLIYLAMHQIGALFFPDSIILSEEFGEKNLLYKLTIVGLWGKFTLYKYISCWLLSEGVATCFGLTFVKKEKDGSEDWSGCENIKLIIFENASKMHAYIESFNVNTNHWVAQYVFKRLKFLGNRNISHLSTLMFLAVWHGFHSGYYVCFLMEFSLIIFERDFIAMFLGNEKFKTFLNQSYMQPILFVFLKFYTLASMGFSLIPFVFLSYKRWVPVYCNLYFIGIIIFVPWTIIYSPILKMVIRKYKKKPNDKSLLESNKEQKVE